MGYLVGIRLLMNMEQVMQTGKYFSSRQYYPSVCCDPLWDSYELKCFSKYRQRERIKAPISFYFLLFFLSSILFQHPAANSFSTKGCCCGNGRLFFVCLFLCCECTKRCQDLKLTEQNVGTFNIKPIL